MVLLSTRDDTNNNEGLVEGSGLKTVKEIKLFLKFVIIKEMNDDEDDNIEQKQKYWEKDGCSASGRIGDGARRICLEWIYFA